MAQAPWHAADYKYRALICIPVASTTADHVTIIPPAEYDPFWAQVQSTGFDVRFYDANGVAKDHNRTSWTYASRSALFTVEYADYTLATDNTEFMWMYWGYTSATDASTAVATVGGVADCLYIGQASPQRLVVARVNPPGATAPLTRIAKTSWEEIYVWFDLTEFQGDLAQGASYTRESSSFYLASVDWDSTAGTGVYSAGTRDAAMTTQADTAAYEHEGRVYVGVYVTGGTDGDDYTIVWRGVFSEPGNASGESVEARALLQVRDPDEV